MQRAPLLTNGELVGDYHPKFEGGKVVSAVVMPPQAHQELQGKQNKTKPPVVFEIQPRSSCDHSSSGGLPLGLGDRLSSGGLADWN